MATSIAGVFPQGRVPDGLTVVLLSLQASVSVTASPDRAATEEIPFDDVSYSYDPVRDVLTISQRGGYPWAAAATAAQSSVGLPTVRLTFPVGTPLRVWRPAGDTDVSRLHAPLRVVSRGGGDISARDVKGKLEVNASGAGAITIQGVRGRSAILWVDESERDVIIADAHLDELAVGGSNVGNVSIDVETVQATIGIDGCKDFTLSGQIPGELAGTVHGAHNVTVSGDFGPAIAEDSLAVTAVSGSFVFWPWGGAPGSRSVDSSGTRNGLPTWSNFLRDDALSPAGKAALPPGLVEDIEAQEWDPARSAVIPTREERFRSSLRALLQAADESVAPFDPAYHNSGHFRWVLSGVQQQMGIRRTDGRPLPDAVEQAMQWMAVGHDYAHPGATFRRDALPGADGTPQVARPDLGLDISTEMVSAILVDRRLKAAGASLGARVLVAHGIDASTFGNPDKGPRTDLEAMLVAADLHVPPEVEQFHQNNLNVLYRERPARPPAATFGAYVQGLLEFLNYAEAHLTPEARTLTWGHAIARHRAHFEQMQRGAAGTGRAAMEQTWQRARRQSEPPRRPGTF